MKKFLIAASSLLLALQPTAAPAQTTHDNVAVGLLLADGSRACFFFTLVGVSVADPATGNEWFAVPRTLQNFSELFAITMTARALHLAVNVTTTGTTSCGLATVDYITIRS